MNRTERQWDGAALLVIVLATLGFTVGVLWRRAQLGEGMPSYDIYSAHYPNIIYALRALRAGHGLLWNSLQNCGQPFLPSTVLAPFYPLNWLFLIVDINSGFLLAAGLHLVIGAGATYFLCREYGLSHVAALCGAFGFGFSASAVQLAVWNPVSNLGIYVLMPLAALLVERILKTPTTLKGIALGSVLTLQLLGANPQFLLFTYQILALRLVWELGTRKLTYPVRTLGALALGFTLPPLLGALQLLPMIEFARTSIRSGPLTLAEMKPGTFVTWAIFRSQLAIHRSGYGVKLALFPIVLGGFAILWPGRRRIALFYLLAGGFFLSLAFDNPVFELYRKLPFGSLFRSPERFIWLTAFSLSVLMACGVDVATHAYVKSNRRRWAWLATPLVGGTALVLLPAPGLPWWEWGLLGGMLLSCAVMHARGRLAQLAPAALVVLVFVDLLGENADTFLVYLKSGNVIYRHEAVFRSVKAPMTPQDRMYQLGRHPDYSLMPKTPMVFGIPSVLDYEPQTSRRYAELIMKLVYGPDAGLNDLNVFYFLTDLMATNRSILNLLAARYVVIDPVVDRPRSIIGPPLRLLREIDGLRIYENPAALPRAFYVPQVEVLPDPKTVLERVGWGRADFRRVALVEAAPADGFTGRDPAATGDVVITKDEDENVELRVRATADGFVVLSDQLYPGWEATVNGTPTPIMRANYAFRAIRVPAGESTVVFRYRPLSVRAGVLISGVTLAVIAAYLLRSATRRRTATV